VNSTPEIKDGTLAALVATVAAFYSINNTAGWNDYPVYVECDDGAVRKVKLVGSCVVPHGLKGEQFAYDGGFYLKAEL